MLYNLILFIIKILVNSPFYPHWLNNLKSKQLEKVIMRNISGFVLEVGAGDASRKNNILFSNSKIKKYILSDYSSWDQEFSRVDNLVSSLGEISSVFFGFKKRGKLDLVCDAMNLPFKNARFNYHLSFEVLEHISNPFLFFSEATRVLKKNGKIILSVPVFYRVHGVGMNHQFDYFRYMPGFFLEVAKLNNLKLKKIHFNTGLGTTVAQMTNQYLIEKIKEVVFVLKIPLCLLSLLVFPVTNLLGLLIDIWPDMRFSNRYYVVFEKL